MWLARVAEGVVGPATGFLSQPRWQTVYVTVGAIVGLVFLAQSSDLLPNLDQ